MILFLKKEMTKLKSHIGIRYGRLLVIDDSLYQHPPSGKVRACKVQCDCGTIKIVRLNTLVLGLTQSCGCIFTEMIVKRNTKHGLSKDPLYGMWLGMKNRCYIKSNNEYHNYGGRGIKVCDEWRSDFVSFHKWAYSHGYQKGLTIDRIENDGNYEPNNCRWATHVEQGQNRSNNHKLYFNNKYQTLSQWAREVDLSPGVILSRIKRGWSTEKILTTPKLIGSPYAYKKYQEQCQGS